VLVPLPPYAGKAPGGRLRTEGAQGARRTVTLGGAIGDTRQVLAGVSPESGDVEAPPD